MLQTKQSNDPNAYSVGRQEQNQDKAQQSVDIVDQ